MIFSKKKNNRKIKYTKKKNKHNKYKWIVYPLEYIYNSIFLDKKFKEHIYNKNTKCDSLMIVAHPDDEFIFGSKYLLKHKWCIVNITNGTYNSRHVSMVLYDRKKEFRHACNIFNIEGRIWNFKDSLFHIPWNTDILKNKLKNLLLEKKWKRIVTHCKKGEYGHNQHKLVHKYVMKTIVNYNIHPKNGIFVFGKSKKKINIKEEEKMKELIKILYKSQNRIINNLIDLILYSKHIKFNPYKKI